MKKEQRDIQLATSFTVYNAKMVMVITTLKIATQFLSEWFSKPPFEVHANFKDDGSVNFVLRNDETDEALKGLEKLQNVFNGKERGTELLVLTRNPLKRYISALNQDFIKPVFISNIGTQGYLNIMLEYIIKDGESYINFPYTKEERMSRYLELTSTRALHDVQINDEYIKSLPKEYLEFICFNIITRILSRPNYEIFKGHNGEWNKPLLQLLNFIKNPKQIRVIDIDTQNLSAALSKYEIGTKSLDPIHTSKNITPLLEKIVSTLDIEEALDKEILSHNILKLKWGDKNL